MQKLTSFIIFFALALVACRKYAPSASGTPTTTTPPTTSPPISSPAVLFPLYDSLKYDSTYTNWQAFKKGATNGYSFIIFAVSWAEPRHRETKITVINNVIVARDYTVYDYDANGVKVIYKEWHEDKANINTHDIQTWFVTMDDVYLKAKTEWLTVDPKKNTIYLETKNNGLISTAGYVPSGCADDCFFGVNITSITAL